MKAKIALLAVLLILIGVATAFSASPHFVGTPTLTSSGASVTVCFKEAGLGDNEEVAYTLSADATALYVCKNGGGQCPDAANKESVQGRITVSGVFRADKNGHVNACLRLDPIGPGSFACPNGQTTTLASASFSNVTITDTTDGVSALSNPQGASFTLFVCP